MRKIAQGLTLIELMIVLAVIVILMAIALPSYNGYIRRAHRGHAKAALLRAAHWMERVATAQGTYPITLAAGLQTVEGNRYTVGFWPNATLTSPLPADLAQVGFTLVAQRIPGGGNANDKCGDFTLDNLGVRQIVNHDASATLADCWGK